MERCPRHWTLHQRIEFYLAPPDARGCRLWTKSVTPKGYGRINYKNRKWLVHRAMLEKYLGRPIPDDLLALHHCDVPNCCTESHLYEGTVQDNADDMWARGREVVLRGSKNGWSKLTEQQVKDILLSTGTYQAIADRFGISKQTVWMIRKRRHWRHVQP